jgi:epoxyqueuosine reductase QueG
MSLTNIIKEKAHHLGFALTGVTTPDPPPHWPVYEQWLSMGRHGSMDYLADRRRADPRLVLPECRSILVLAVSYPDPGSVAQNEGPHPAGCVAAFA